MKHVLILSAFFLLVITGCDADPADVAASRQLSFRVRSDFAAALNADQGWAGEINENVTVEADRPFRVRFEVERTSGSNGSWQFRLQYRRNGGDWTEVETHDFPHPETEDAKTPRVSIVSCSAYKNGATTTDLLTGSPAGFKAGAGVSLADRSPAWNGAGAHSEFEWPLVVRRFADGAVTNDEGDTFELRMIEAGGALMGNYRSPLLRLAIPPRHVGGTFVETPGRIGPFQASNGDLYFIMEPAETDNLFMMIKSSDGGLTWREVDGANRPATDDLESVDARQVGDTIHIIHQVTRSSRYHSFRTSDHPTRPDSWAARDELVASPNSVAQAATLVVRSDGSMVAFYVGHTVQYSMRSAAGAWGPSRIMDAGVAPNLAGPRAVLGANDTVHFACYGTDGTIWYRKLLRDGTLTERQQLASGAGTTRAEYGAVLPLIHIPETNTVVIIYRLADGKLWERRVINDGPPTAPVQVTDRDVITNAVDSQQPGADAVLDGTTIRVFFIEKSSRSIFSTNDQKGWQPSTLLVDNILGSWIRGNVFTRKDGARVYGYVYDAGSDGGAGMNRFGEIVLSSPDPGPGQTGTRVE
ncbi:MAG: exo-alpha-sialidase [Acidobacteriota bacterium]